MNDTTLDLSVIELEDMVGMSGCSQAGMDPRACDASLGGAVGLSLAFSVIAIAVT
ncbi:hypothetical protein JNUCC0626_21015 [Lentzea sp. JNUCC 0626]|uniref:hypothetical protein n=1 Tax=Lentzea sp. JNUCC 0626 TaxID=3367513 RepID=UPI003748B529